MLRILINTNHLAQTSETQIITNLKAISEFTPGDKGLSIVEYLQTLQATHD